MVTSCNFEEMTLFLQSGCKTNSLWTFLINSETHHVPPDFEIYVEWYLKSKKINLFQSFLYLWAFNFVFMCPTLCQLKTTCLVLMKQKLYALDTLLIEKLKLSENDPLIFKLLGECYCWWTKGSQRAHVAKFYGRFRLICSVLGAS